MLFLSSIIFCFRSCFAVMLCSSPLSWLLPNFHLSCAISVGLSSAGVLFPFLAPGFLTALLFLLLNSCIFSFVYFLFPASRSVMIHTQWNSWCDAFHEKLSFLYQWFGLLLLINKYITLCQSVSLFWIRDSHCFMRWFLSFSQLTTYDGCITFFITSPLF